MAFLWAEVILGRSSPMLVDFVSRITEGSGELPSVLIPICPMAVEAEMIIIVPNAKIRK
jgi:hypothetical protein